RFVNRNFSLLKPQGLPDTMTVADFVNHFTKDISVGKVPEGGVTDRLPVRRSDIARAPLMYDSDAQELPNPTLSWFPATQVKADPWLAVQTLNLQGNNSHEWRIHLPAGVSEMAFPAIPAGVDASVFDGSTVFYNIDVKAFSAGGKGYTEAVKAGELYEVPVGQDYDELHSDDTAGFYR
ncbi:MAG: hypothetical protein KDI36_17525, partial [Pseudomonadales bacterium]|nr:hypothetical protein [Pseudomonadales bacterium]